jgi:hypothetical protein
MPKRCIFVIGARNSGKTSVIHGLTGCGVEGLWNVRGRGNNALKALVLLSAITERGDIVKDPAKFPKSVESRFAVNRRGYDILICAFELRTWGKYSLDKYIRSAQRKNFSTKAAIIGIDWQGIIHPIDGIKTLCRQNNTQYSSLNANNDYNSESGKIRRRFYP